MQLINGGSIGSVTMVTTIKEMVVMVMLRF